MTGRVGVVGPRARVGGNRSFGLVGKKGEGEWEWEGKTEGAWGLQKSEAEHGREDKLLPPREPDRPDHWHG